LSYSFQQLVAGQGGADGGVDAPGSDQLPEPLRLTDLVDVTAVAELLVLLLAEPCFYNVGAVWGLIRFGDRHHAPWDEFSQRTSVRSAGFGAGTPQQDFC